MRLTLFNTGQEIEWAAPGEKKGRDRVVAALERDNAAQKPYAQRVAEAGRANLTLSVAGEEASAKRDFGIGLIRQPLTAARATTGLQKRLDDEWSVPDSVAKGRRAIIRAAYEAWNAKQLDRPGPRGVVEHQSFRDDLEAALEKFDAENGI